MVVKITEHFGDNKINTLTPHRRFQGIARERVYGTLTEPRNITVVYVPNLLPNTGQSFILGATGNYKLEIGIEE